MNVIYPRSEGAALFDQTHRSQHPERDDTETLLRLRERMAGHVERSTPETAILAGHLLRWLADADDEIERQEAGR